MFSDLHLEFGAFPKPDVEADVVLAGGLYTKDRVWLDGDAAEFFGCPVVAVLGNHDYYGVKVDTAAAKGITLLEREEAIVAGIRFLGCTLWSDFRLFAGNDLVRVRNDASFCVGDYYSSGLNDFRRIRVARDGYRKFRPLDAAMIHAAFVAWLDEQLSRPSDGPTVVVTHHAPSARCVPEARLADRRSCAYASHLDWLIEKHAVAAWCFGHVHDSKPPFRIGSTRMVSNPRGYFPADLNPDFDPSFVIELESGAGPEPL